MPPSQPPRYALLNCEDAAKWAGHETIAHGVLHEEAEWDHFNCCAGELPPLDTLGRYTGVFITGGHYSAYEERPWIGALAAWLGGATQAHPEVRFLGICFGCQILARGLGGEVGKNPSRRFVLKVEELRLAPELRADPTWHLALADAAAAALQGGEGQQAQPVEQQREEDGRRGLAGEHGSGAVGRDTSGLAEGAPVDSSAACSDAGVVRLIQSHGDQVLRLPEGGRVLATSDTAPVEIWSWGRNVLALQGHPELTPDMVMEKIYPAITAAGRLTPEESEAAAHSLATTLPDSQLVIHLMRRFMERGLECCGNGGGATQLEQPEAEDATGAAGGNAATGERAVGSSSEQLAPVPASTAAVAAAAAAESTAATASPERPARGRGDDSSSSGSAGADDLARALEALGMGVGAELAKGPSEYQLLQECNAAAEGQYRHMGRVVAQANRVLQAVQEQQGALGPALEAIDSLEAQVCQLERVMAHMEATASRLQHNLEALDKGG